MSLPFYLVNAFTNRFEGGNPAGVVFLETRLPDDDLANIAKNLNQPATTFLLPQTENESDPSSKTFEVRWFTPVHEIPLCGHGSLAASGTIFGGGSPVGQGVKTIHLKNPNGNTIIAQKQDPRVYVSLPASSVQPLGGAEEEEVRKVVRRALGKEDLIFEFVGVGGQDFEHFLFVEINGADLSDLSGDLSAFKQLGYKMHVITSASPSVGVSFQSRVFGRGEDIFEDPVCGSAHSLLTPYWAEKSGHAESRVAAKQVSKRGGDLEVSWQRAEGRVTLGGEYRIVAKGNILI